MRILSCAVPSTGHIEPMVPLIQALVRGGHQLAWASHRDTHARLQALGVQRCFDVGPSLAAARAEYQRRWPQTTPSLVASGDPGLFSRLFAEVFAPAMLDGLVGAIREWAPQLVVSETATLAAPLACELTHCVQVTHGFGMPPAAALLQEAAQALEPLWRKTTGAAPAADAGLFRHRYLDIYPPALQPPERVRLLRCQPLRPCEPQHGAGQAPDLPTGLPADWRPDLPLIYLTFGTVVNGAQALQTAAAALAGLPARVIVTVGQDGDPERLRALSPKLQVERFIAQRQLLPHCDLVVSHGGSGTFLAALAHGLPQLLLPQGADQFINAAALQASGAGVALQAPDSTAGRVQDAALALLQGPHYRHQAARIADDIAAMPGADVVAAMLERL